MHKKRKNLIAKIIVGLLVVSMIIPVIASIALASDIGEGEGGESSISGAGIWLHVSGAKDSQEAWNKFESIQMTARKKESSSWRNDSLANNQNKLKNLVNNSGRGAMNADGSYESLYETCKRSQYIWWYGAGEHNDYTNKYWYTQTRNSHRVSFDYTGLGEEMDRDALYKLEDYQDWSDLWSEGQVVLICSAVTQDVTQEPVPEPKLPLLFVGIDKVVNYNGQPQTASGLNTAKTNIRNLKSNHKYTVDATVTATNPGTYPVPVKNVSITDKSTGESVADQYIIEVADGRFQIVKQLEEKDDYRCINRQTDSASAYIYNETIGFHGYTPNSAPSLSTSHNFEFTPAFEVINSMPTPSSPMSAWYSWKAIFESGSDETSPELDLESNGVASTLSKHGGVYNIIGQSQEETYTATHCQPQTRRLETKTRYYDNWECEIIFAYDENGDFIIDEDGRIVYWEDCGWVRRSERYQEWTPWKDEGPRIIESISMPYSRTKDFSYQILSVNCNRSGFNNVKSGISGSDMSLASGDVGGVFVTAKKEGIDFPLGGSAYTSSFYTDGSSCNPFTCTSERGSASDSNNNRQTDEDGNVYAYTEYSDPSAPGFTNSDNEIVFFRDNEKRVVRIDVWYPRGGAADLSVNSSASSTYAGVYNEGLYKGWNELTEITPLNYPNIHLNQYLRNWSGSTNKFVVSSQWVSEKGKPYKMGAHWQYTANARNIVPRIVDGHSVISMTSPKSYYFDVICSFSNNQSNTSAKIPQTPIRNGVTSPSWNPNDTTGSNIIKILFTRSASDTQ